ncbi:hypothetical protein Taro_018263 [Colocasia esculenta]|uniref:Uncharacterized protein n=1 Tax=Colocasia esculenta TaxID=4460 RepID=A0A843UVP2_COLES|nr:hypothetical protein [Colocasia esculenta]
MELLFLFPSVVKEDLVGSHGVVFPSVVKEDLVGIQGVRYGTWRTEWEGFHLRKLRVHHLVHARDCLPIYADDRDCLSVYANYRDRLPDHASSATFPFFLTTRWRASIQQRMMRGLKYLDGSDIEFRGKLDHFKLTVFVIYVIQSMYKLMCNCRGKIDPGSASRYITTLVHAHILGPVDAWREFLVPVWDLLYDMFIWRYVFTRPEDLPRARAVWESTAQTNLRKSMFEARDKAIKTTGSRDPTTWLDYGPVWLRRDY